MNNNKHSLFKTTKLVSSWISIKNKWNVLKLVLISIFIGLLEVISLMSILPILTTFNNKDNLEISLNLGINSNNFLLILAFSFALLLCLISLLKIKTISYGNFLSAKIGQEIGKKLLNNFLGQELLIHRKRDSSEVINTFSIHLTQTIKFIIFFLQLIVALFCTLGVLIFIIYKNPIVVLGTFISVSIIYLFIGRRNKSRNLRAANDVKNSLDRITSIIKEINSDLENNILQYRDETITKKFAQYDKLARLSTAKNRNYTLLPRYIIEATAMSSFIFLAMLSALILKQDNITLIATLSASLFGMQKLLPSMNLIYQSWNMMNFCTPSVYSVKNLIYKYADKDRLKDASYKVHPFRNLISLSNISFGYKKNKLILKNLNLNLKKGEKLLIKGKSGLGKSTLINIICSLLTPSSGEIHIDGKKLGKEISKSQWRRQIGLVKQKPILRSGTILDLIVGYEVNEDKNAALKKARYFANLACIDKFIESLPNKYMHEISENGNSFSGGQVQRIAIASILALKPALIILDESTSGVDINTESQIFKNILGINDLTILAISHSTNVDKFFENKLFL